MRKLAIRFIVSLLTFSAGVTTFLLCGYFQAAEEVSASQLQSAILEGWEKVEAKGQFSFYIPPDMKRVELSCHLSDWDGGDLLANQSLILDYGYGKRTSCDSLLSRPNKATLQTFKVEIGARAARLQKSAEGNSSQMHLCVPYVGGGKTTLSLRIVYRDNRGADVARQIFDTIEFK